MKPMLKQPGTKHLKLKCDILLTTFAFKFNLRRYNVVAPPLEPVIVAACPAAAATLEDSAAAITLHGTLIADLVAVDSPGEGTGRGLHSSTCRLNVSAFCGIGGAFGGGSGGV